MYFITIKDIKKNKSLKMSEKWQLLSMLVNTTVSHKTVSDLTNQRKWK